jgi:amino acid transporter
MGPRYGWYPGWLALVGWLTGTAGVAYAFAQYFAPYVGLGSANRTIVVITALVLLTWAVIHLIGMKFASLLNNFSVTAELAGTLLIGLGLLIYSLVHGTNHISLTSTAGAVGPVGLGAFAVSSLTALYTLTGFEGAADLAEESENPLRSVPRAIVNSVVISGVAGFVVLLGFTLAIPNVSKIASSPTPLYDIVRDHIGAVPTALFMTMVYIAIFACGLINLAAVSRLGFSMARDDVLPFSRQLRRVGPRHGVPFIAVIVSTIISILFTLVAKAEAVITSVSSLAVYTSYGLIIIGGLINRNKLRSPAGSFSLGRFLGPVAVLTLAWLVVVDLALTVPAVNHQAAKGGAVVLILGVLWYVVRIRRLPTTEHLPTTTTASVGR